MLSLLLLLDNYDCVLNNLLQFALDLWFDGRREVEAMSDDLSLSEMSDEQLVETAMLAMAAGHLDELVEGEDPHTPEQIAADEVFSAATQELLSRSDDIQIDFGSDEVRITRDDVARKFTITRSKK